MTLEQLEKDIATRENVKTYETHTRYDNDFNVIASHFIIETWDNKKLVLVVAPQPNDTWTITHMGELK